MATFQNTPEEWQRLDYLILQNGWVSLYLRNEILNNDLDWFKSEYYTLIDFDCGTWADENQMHRQLKQKLNFPDHYGENFNALTDCLTDIEIEGVGQVVVFRNLDKIGIDIAQRLLDSFANSARQHMLFGNRLIVLAQVSSPDFQIDQIGATPVVWNRAEWLKSNRH